MNDKVALILGYGPRVGFAVAESLAMNGYKVAVVSRSDKYSDSAKNNLQIQADLSIPSSVEGIFTKVIKELGHPTVVVYNGNLSLRY
jgi:NAD(P)-dependent dehydrogenase (short-subunit alcohol dehydrogenase family)